MLLVLFGDSGSNIRDKAQWRVLVKILPLNSAALVSLSGGQILSAKDKSGR